MDPIKQLYDEFILQGPLTEDTLRDICRLCGYAPTKKQIIRIPNTYNEFRDCLREFEDKPSKEEMIDQMMALCGGNAISKNEIIKLLNSGDKLSEEEISLFFRLVTSENDTLSVKEIVETIYIDK